ncbi:hypothetical protein ACSLBF_00240 [Pseudoalteromonas sp. T1lg65]
MLNSAAPCSPSTTTLSENKDTKPRFNWSLLLTRMGQQLSLKNVVMYK